MLEVNIKPVWLFRTESGQDFDLQLLNLLREIHATGKLTHASTRVGLSYRHAWNMIARWSDFFGNPLVRMEKGRGAKLTLLGEKLLWAEERIQARLAPQFKNLCSELELEINRALNESKQVLRIRASHGYAIAKLVEHMSRCIDIQLDLQYLGSREALQSLERRECDLAGFHIPESLLGKEAIERFYPEFHRRPMTTIHFVTRRQGLILAKNNPLKLNGFQDITQKNARYINRQHGSGTRMLFELLLEHHGIQKETINGYQQEEFTHDAVAAFVASGMADAGLGIEAAARHFNLDFIPLAREHYMLACRPEAVDTPYIRDLLILLKTPSFREAINNIPGYAAPLAGVLAKPGELFDEQPTQP
ncbi:MAG: helix-turn-helix transcriptional regulator [Pseudomonadota bacterium]|nr:helix-turn-helix transcriptional regulator [Pseudomonadota bacterium]